MPVNHALSVARQMASPASIETKKTYESNKKFYREMNYTYIPLPFDSEFYDIENDEVRAMKDDQYVHGDASIRNVIEHLQGRPFLLIEDLNFFREVNEKFEFRGTLSGYEEGFKPGEEFFTENPDLEEEILDECQNRQIFHIITLADVNRRVVKETIYSVIAELENRFASEIKESDLDEPDLYPDLNPETVGRWEKARHGGLQTDISEHMMVSEMITIVGKNSELRSRFGYPSRNQFKNNLGSIVDLRNAVMHPSKTLVKDESDLSKLIDRISRAEEAIEAHGGEVIKGNYRNNDFGPQL